MIPAINWVAVLGLILTAAALLLSRDWRWMLGILAVQYLGVFWMTGTQWPIVMALVKLLTGWTACAVLGMTRRAADEKAYSETAWPQSRLFRLAAAGLVVLVSLALANRTALWLDMEMPIAWGSLLLIGMGLLVLGMTAQPLRIIMALLTTLSGFEILYAGVETSILVTTLLAVITLGLALTGAYLVNPRGMETTE